MRKIAAAALAAVALGCAPSHPASHPLSTVSDFCAVVVARYAEELERCVFATPAYVALWTGQTDLCAPIEAAVAAGRTVYSPAEAEACLNALEGAPCGAIEDAERYAPACDRIFAGTLPPGATCASSDECAGGSCAGDSGCGGTCVADLGAGALCIASPAECGPGLVCDSTHTNLCAANAPGAIGAPCGPADLCQLGAFCDPATAMCAATRPAGASCLDAWEACAGGTRCHPDSWASPTRAECVPYVGVGSACGEWVGTCGPGAHCQVTDVVSGNGQCVADSSLGGPCAVDGDCLQGFCDGATCTAPRPVGGACTATSQCADGWCDLLAGTCAAPKAIGAACTSSGQCGAGAWCDGTTHVCTAACGA